MSAPDNLPKVSIITACHNSARTLEQTILSVRQQTYKNIEYIIVDAVSDDGTANIIGKYRDDIIWIREPDRGIADAWNKGIKQATGAIIGIANADDFYLPDTIETIVNAFSQHPDCGFVFGDLEVINDTTGDKYIVRGRPDYERVIYYDMLNLPHPTVFVRSEVYQSIGAFDLKYRIALDYEFIRRMVSNNVRGWYIPRIMAVMREGGLSDTHRIAAFKEVMEISVAYGYNRLWARAYFSFKCLRTYLGRMMDRLGVDVVARRKIRHFIKGSEK